MKKYHVTYHSSYTHFHMITHAMAHPNHSSGGPNFADLQFQESGVCSSGWPCIFVADD